MKRVFVLAAVCLCLCSENIIKENRNPMGVLNPATIFVEAGNQYMDGLSIYCDNTLLYAADLPCTITVPARETITAKFSSMASNFAVNYQCDCLDLGNNNYQCTDDTVAVDSMVWVIAERI
jgi:hypothetical protein